MAPKLGAVCQWFWHFSNMYQKGHKTKKIENNEQDATENTFVDWGNAMVFYPRYGLILSNIQRNWFAISSDARRARKVLQFNFEECWTVLIHTSDKRPSHSHCYQVNDCQVTYIKNILLLKGGQYFCTEKKYVPPFSTKNIFIIKRRNIFLYWKKPSSFY